MKNNRWAQVVIGTIVLLFAGLIYAWSVMSRPIAAEFPEWSTSALSLTFTIVMITFCLGGFVSGLLSGKVQLRFILWAAAILYLIGMYIASTAKSLAVLYIGFGVLCGFASGLPYNAVISAVTKWFPDKQGLASGILLLGFGIGSFLIGKVYTAALATASWRAEFRVLAIILFVILALSGFLIQRPTPEQTAKFATGVKKSSASAPRADFTPGQMLKTGAFWMFLVWAVVLSAAGLALISQASGIVAEVSPALAAGSIATIVGLISIFNGLGRVLFGGMFDRLGYRKNMLLNNASYLISVIITIFALRSSSLVILVIGFICFGLSYGGVMPTNSAFINSFFGAKHYPVNFSLITLNLIIASFGSTVAGMVYDAQGSYMAIFFIMIGAVVIGTILTLLIRKPKAPGGAK